MKKIQIVQWRITFTDDIMDEINTMVKYAINMLMEKIP
jgi:hypothetical protein